MGSHPIDVQKFDYLAARQKLKNRQEICRASGLGLRVLVKVLSGKPVDDEKTIAKLARAVGLGDNYAELILWEHESARPGNGYADELTPTILGGQAHAGRDTQDVKLVLDDLRLSRSLLVRKAVPSFAECLLATQVVTPKDDAHKDYPLLPGTQYNHFLQPAIVVTLDVKNQPNVIAYTREKRVPQPSNVHTKGMSILFGASPHWKIDRQQKTPLDHWLATIDEPKQAKKSLLSGPAPAILQFVQYKIDLLRYETVIVPLGVITKDERESGHHRVYSQFVFHVRLKAKSNNLDELVYRIPTRGLGLCRLSPDINAQTQFVGKDGCHNMMDVVAWRGLHSRAQKIKHVAATFWRDFRIV